MTYKKLTIILLAVLSITLTACTLGDLPVIGRFFGKKPAGPVTLNMWGLWEDPEIMNELIRKYQETHPNVTINYEDRSILKPSDYKETFFARSTDQVGADIASVHNSWVPRLKNSLSSMPPSLMDTQKYAELFYPAAVDTSVFEGKIYAVPLYYDGLVLLYNKDHFEEIGQTAPPTAWEEFRRLALELSRRSGENGEELVRAGAAMGAADNIEHFSDILGLVWAQAGVSIPNDLDSKAAEDAFRFYINFMKEDRVWDPSYPEAVTAFAQGQVSMIFAPSWRILEILNSYPNLNFGVAHVPQAIPQNPASWGTFWVNVVPSSSKNQEAAWEFLNFLAQEEQQLLLFNRASEKRQFGAPFSLKSLAGQLVDHQYLGPVLDMAPYSKSAEIAGRAGNSRQTNALLEAVNAVQGGKSAADVLKKAKETITQ